MSNMNHKWLRILLLIALPAFSVGQAAGQNVEPYGFAGDNLIKDLWEGQALDVTLGKQGNTSECVYEWSLESFPDNVGRPTIASPTLPITTVTFFDSGSYEFVLTRVSKYGYQKEYVTVLIYEEITLVSAKQVYENKCWREGDAIRESDFDFETDPPGYEGRVRVYGEDASVSLVNVKPVSDKEVRFTIEGQNGIEQVRAVISVINTSNEFSIGVPFGTSNTPTKMKENWQKLKVAAEKLKTTSIYTKYLDVPCYTGFIGKMKKFAGGVHFEPVHDVDIVPSIGFKTDCCDGDAAAYFVLGGKLKCALGFNMDAPIPGYSLPGVGGLAIMGSFVVEFDVFPLPELSFPLTTSDYSNCFQTSFSVPVRATAELVGGIEIVSRDIASADVGFEVASDVNFSIHTSSPYVTSEGSGAKVYAKVEAQLVSINVSIFKYELYPELKLLD